MPVKVTPSEPTAYVLIGSAILSKSGDGFKVLATCKDGKRKPVGSFPTEAEAKEYADYLNERI
jgi:hypothetical protein